MRSRYHRPSSQRTSHGTQGGLHTGQGVCAHNRIGQRPQQRQGTWPREGLVAQRTRYNPQTHAPQANVKAHAYQHGVGPQNHLRGCVGGARHYRPDRRHRAVWLQHTMRDQVHPAVWQHPLRLPCSNATAPHRFDTGGIECAQRQFYVAGIQRCNSHIPFRSVTPSGQQMPAPAVTTRLGAKADRWTPGTRPSWAAPASHTIAP